MRPALRGIRCYSVHIRSVRQCAWCCHLFKIYSWLSGVAAGRGAEDDSLGDGGGPNQAERRGAEAAKVGDHAAGLSGGVSGGKCAETGRGRAAIRPVHHGAQEQPAGTPAATCVATVSLLRRSYIYIVLHYGSCAASLSPLHYFTLLLFFGGGERGRAFHGIATALLLCRCCTGSAAVLMHTAWGDRQFCFGAEM